MIRVASAEEREQEERFQNVLFKVNLLLFAGTIVAIKAGK